MAEKAGVTGVCEPREAAIAGGGRKWPTVAQDDKSEERFRAKSSLTVLFRVLLAD